MRKLKAVYLRSITGVVAAIALILAGVGPALAFVPRGGVHPGGRVFVGPHFGPRFFGPRFGPRFFGPRFFGPVVVGSAFWPGYYPSVVYPPVVAPGYAPPSDYWYYCPDIRGYYPYVQQCPSGWLQVVPSPEYR